MIMKSRGVRDSRFVPCSFLHPFSFLSYPHPLPFFLRFFSAPALYARAPARWHACFRCRNARATFNKRTKHVYFSPLLLLPTTRHSLPSPIQKDNTGGLQKALVGYLLYKHPPPGGNVHKFDLAPSLRKEQLLRRAVPSDLKSPSLVDSAGPA